MRADTEAFDAFVRARLPHLLRFGRALTGDEHAAADLVQDALERTLMRWSKVTSEDPEGYVRRAMVNRSISVWRKLARERLTDDRTTYSSTRSSGSHRASAPSSHSATTKTSPRRRPRRSSGARWAR